MIKYDKFDLYMEESVDKQLQIEFDGGTITNKEIPSEQFSLTESLSSDGLMFGSCEASEVRFRIYNVFTPLKDKWLTVTQVLDKDYDNPLQIGKYKVYSDKPTADRSYRDVVAYDSMFDIINADVASWYNSLTFPMQLKTFRDSFFDYFGIDQEEVALVNDAMTIEKTIEPSVLSGKDVLQSICQINGCFGHIGRDGKMQYVFLNAILGGLYPSNDIYPADDLYPIQPNVQIVSKGLYVESPTYEDFTVKAIDKLQMREKEGDIGVIVGNGDNTYIVEDNFLVYGKSTDELTVIANNMLSVIDGLEYRPFDAVLVGNPCFEVGDIVRINTKHQIIDSYVLQRTISGVQCLRDDFSAEGEEYQSEKVNDIQTDIKQLKGKSNTLERTIEETRSTIANMEEGLQSEITQTAESITSTVASTYETKTDASKTKEELQSSIEQTAESITQTVSATYETKTDAGKTKKELQTSIEQTAESITSTVASSQSKWDTTGITVNIYGYGSPEEQYKSSEYKEKIYLDQSSGNLYVGTSTKWVFLGQLELITDELSSQIEQAVGSIVLKVDANGKIVEVALTGDPEEGTTFTVDADNISLTATEVIDMLTNGDINLTGKNITITSDNFSVDADGNMSCNNASVTGDVNATTLNAYNKLRLFIGTTFDKDYRDAIWVQSNEDESPNDVEWLVYSNIRRMMLPVVFKQGITVNGSSSLGEVSASNVNSWGNVQSPGVIMASHVRPMSDGGSYCGVASYKWKDVYSQKSSNNTSDRNLKHDINPISSVYEDLFFKMKPVSYMFNTGDRKHWGFISQDLEEAMNELGLTSEDCAAFCKDIKVEYFVDENGNTVEKQVLDEEGNPQYIYGIRYGEFTPLNTHMIQQAYKKIETQQQEIEELKKSVSFLMSKLGDDSNG